jgi:uncharacterized linocin/CFP29 family protein
MNSILKRHLAPLSDEIWRQIDEQAAAVLKGNLSGRALVPFNGPHGLSAAAINLGLVAAAQKPVVDDVQWGLRKVLPLIEIYAPFALSLEDLEQVDRGGLTPELDPVIQAAHKTACFEETAIYKGLPEGGYAGLLDSSPHKPVALPVKPEGFAGAIGNAVLTLQKQSINGPYHLVLGTGAYQALTLGELQGGPLRKFVDKLLLGGSIKWSPVLNEGGALFSGRGGDAELTVGQDYAVGFAGTHDDTANFFLMASFAFRVIEPAAAIALVFKA